ncbi:MAG: hypothetical protein NTX65_08110 [Ignavibacteriales bacterium]|nr:hypothetical protein [Ignavibacteriales bacterium]
MSGKFKILLLYSTIVLFSAILFAGCSSSRLIDSWKDQTYKRGTMKNVLVLAINNNKLKKRIWEDSYVEALRAKGIKATPSYNYYPNDVPQEKDIPNLFKDNYDGIVLIQKVNEESKKYRVPGRLYYMPLNYGFGFRRWYGMGYSVIRTPGYIERETITQIETTLWEPTEDGKMIWSAITESVNPSSPKIFSKEVSELVIPKMIRDRIIVPRRR